MIRSLIDMQLKIDVALSNFLLAANWKHWPEIDASIVAEAKSKLSEKQRADFFVEKM